MGLHPANPLLTSSLQTLRFLPQGEWLRLAPVSETTHKEWSTNTETDSMVEAEPLSNEALAGKWQGFVLPHGYPVELDIQFIAGELTGSATMSASQNRRWTGRFTRLSSTVGAVLGTVVFGDTDELHIHIDATLRGNDLSGSWTVYEIESLSGQFQVWQHGGDETPRTSH